MYKILIIDDEESVRDAIKMLGEWDKLGIDGIFEAQDGLTGIKLLYEEKPDIVLLDMRMPEMDGVEFLQASEKEYSHAVNIVISGYDDYEFTRQAIKSKVFDYLLKPINEEKLNSALSKATDSIVAQREKQRELLDRSAKMNLSLYTLKEKTFMSAIEGNFNEAAQGTYLDMIGIDEKIKCYGVAVLKVLNSERISKSDYDDETDLLFYAVINITDEICQEYIKCFCCRNFGIANEIMVVVLENDKNYAETRQRTGRALKRAIRKVKELLGLNMIAGVGYMYPEFSMLSASFKSAEILLNCINLLDMCEPVILDCKKSAKSYGYSILNKLPMIKSAIESSSIGYTLGILYEHMRKISESGYFSLRDAVKTQNELIFMMNDIALEFDTGNDIMQDVESALKANGLSFDYISFDDFEQMIYDITKFFYEKVRHSVNSLPKFSVGSIREYIQNNYHQEINISMFAKRYYLSKVYVMKLFKQAYGYSIYEYVQRVRMEKAVEFLRDASVSIQDISQMVGYSNNNYFSKAFKNFYHISPSEYRILSHEKPNAIPN